MSQSRHHSRRTLPSQLFGEKCSSLLAIVIIGMMVLLNPPQLNGHHGLGLPMAYQVATSSFASVSSTGALNPTNADFNTTRSIPYNSWDSNSSTAWATVNASDSQVESVSAVWRLDPTLIAQAQIIKYDFELATQASTIGNSDSMINATVGLTSSNFEGWYAQSRTPIYPNNTETVSITSTEGQYANGSRTAGVIFDAKRVTNSQANAFGGTSLVLFQQEFPGYAGDATFHHYTIEIDSQSNRTIWILDNTIIATYQLSFVPSNLVFFTSASGSGGSVAATFKDPVQTAIPSTVTYIVTSGFGASPAATNATSSISQMTSVQNQINQLNNRIHNLTSQNSQLQAKASQWFSQWWAGIIWGVLGAGVVGFLFVTETQLRTRRKTSSEETGTNSTCSHCGGTMPLATIFCGECGASMRELGLNCPECGQQMPVASSYCGDCGSQISANDASVQNVAHTSPPAGMGEKEGTWR